MWRQAIKKYSPLLLPLVSSVTYANSFDAEISAAINHSDNALRTSINQISERQDEYSLGIGGEYTNSLIVLEAEYHAREYRFAKDSQPDRNMLEGDTSLLIGKEYHVADLLLTHSRRSISSALDSIDLLQDRDERQIISAVPTLRFRLSGVDNLLLRGNLSKIDYRYAANRESERAGGSLVWQHRFSIVDSFSFTAHYLDVTYDFIPDTDYAYEQVLASYSAQLRQLVYSVQLGYNVSKPELGDDFSAPSYRLEAEYTGGAHTFQLILDQHITDTSMGDGNGGDLFNAISPNDVGDVGFDQLDRRSITLRFSNTSVCGRCTFTLNLGAKEDQYRSLNEDAHDRTAGAGFDYRLSTRSNLGVSLSYLAQYFAEEVLRDNYTLAQLGIYYNYNFFNNIGVGLVAGFEDRNSDNLAQTYEEAVGGISLSYHF